MEKKYSKNDEYIINIEEQEEIINWTKKNYKRLNENGYNRYRGLLEDYEDIPKIVWEIKNRIVKKENLENEKQEPEYKDSIGYMFDGSQLHVHKDPNIDGLIHTRFNVYVKIPEIGGYPVYDGKVLRLKERTYICCRAGLDVHCCQKVYGDRIILSYGFLLPFERVKNIIYDYDIEYKIENIEEIITNYDLDIKNVINKDKYNEINTKDLINLTKIKINEKINLNKFIEKIKNITLQCSQFGISNKTNLNYTFNEIMNDKNNEISKNYIYIYQNILIDSNMKKIITEFINLPKNIKNIDDLIMCRFYSGHMNSGTYLHNHSSTLNYLFRGKKLWLMIPNTSENSSYLKLNNFMYDVEYLHKNEKNIKDWYIKNLLKIKNDIVDSEIFIQNEGEVIFIPNLYYHAVLNLDFCIGITFNL